MPMTALLKQHQTGAQRFVQTEPLREPWHTKGPNVMAKVLKKGFYAVTSVILFTAEAAIKRDKLGLRIRHLA